MPMSLGLSMADLISREDLLITLGSFGVALPPSTKISNEDLSKKLTTALDAAQDLPDLLPAEKVSAGIDVRDYSLWPEGEDVAEATAKAPARTLNVGNHLRRMMESKGLSTAKEDTFSELCQVVLGIGNGVRDGHKHFCLLDAKRVWGVYVRVVQVRKVEGKPLFVLLYKEVASTNNVPFTETNVLPELFGDDNGRVGGIMSVKTTELERMVMLRLFHHNSRRLPANYLPIGKSEARRLGLHASFVLPLVPPHMKILGKLSENSGCEVCGASKISRCIQCWTVAYCGPVCQKADWKNHKETCKSLAGGTWQTICVDPPPKDAITIENAAKAMKRADNLPLACIPEGIHNGKAFLIKIQVSFNNRDTILIYDRQRIFNVYWHRKNDPSLHMEVERISGPALKMYRWARRVSDYEFEVCFDRNPSPTPVW